MGVKWRLANERSPNGMLVWRQYFGNPRKGCVSVTMQQDMIVGDVNNNMKGQKMRTTLSIEVKYDTRMGDDERREVFLQLATEMGRTLYAQASMLAETPPIVIVTTIDRDGKHTHPLFAPESNDEGEDD